jgi:chaperone BCS1
MAFNTSDSEPLLAKPLLESFIPGLSLVSGIFARYFQIDISFYVSFLMLLTGITAGLKYCGNFLFDFCQDWLISTAEIRLDDEMYNCVMYWVSTQRFSQNASHFVSGTKTTSEIVGDRYERGEDQQDNEGADLELAEDERLRIANRDKTKILQYTPSYGTHYFWYKGRILEFTRHREDKQMAIWISYSETIYISCLGRNTQFLKELLQEAQRAYLERDGNKTVIYRAERRGGEEGADWVRCMSRPPRPLSTVVLDPAQKQAFIDDMKEYLHPLTRRWYSNRGIPYRRGYILHGPPGTGKTSLCFAVAGLFGLEIYVASLNSRTLTEESLAMLFQTLPRRCIVLLEDIDTAGITQKRTEEKDPKGELTD